MENSIFASVIAKSLADLFVSVCKLIALKSIYERQIWCTLTHLVFVILIGMEYTDVLRNVDFCFFECGGKKEWRVINNNGKTQNETQSWCKLLLIKVYNPPMNSYVTRQWNALSRNRDILVCTDIMVIVQEKAYFIRDRYPTKNNRCLITIWTIRRLGSRRQVWLLRNNNNWKLKLI